MAKKRIYMNFNDWFCNSDAHGYSSASRDIAKEIWDDIWPTIKASRDDYKRAYVKLTEDRVRQTCELTDALLEYIDCFRRDDAPGFWRWWLDKEKNTKEK